MAERAAICWRTVATRVEQYNTVTGMALRPNVTKENDINVEQQPETIEQIPAEQPAEVATRPTMLSQSQALAVFLACLVLGVVGTLWGIVPLVALAMIGPVVVSFLV